MSAHTAGPWRYSFKTAKTKNIGIYDTHGWLLATLDVHQLARDETVNRTVADARLMAAAPDLLFALQRIAGRCDTEAAYKIAREAVNKATGAA